MKYGIQKAEEKSVFFKRSIYISKDIKAGEKFSENNLRIIRPGNGIAPKYWDEIIGRTAKKDYSAGKPLTMDDFYNG